MKKIIFTGLLAIGTFMSNAQNSFDYSTSTGWSPNIRNIYITTAPGGCTGGVPATTPLGSVPTASTIAITGGRVEYTALRTAHENRIVTPLGNAYDNLYNVDFKFSATSTGEGAGFYIAVLSAQNKNPFYDIPMVTCGAAAIMDAFGIGCYSAANGTSPYIHVDVWDEGVRLTNTATIPIAYGTTYYGRAQVYNNGMGELALFTDELRTIPAGSMCFSIPTTVNNLTFLQHATNSGGGNTRRSSAWVDDVNIYPRQSELCCQIAINGPNVICHDPANPATQNYTVTTTGTAVNYTVSGGAGFSVSGGVLTISNWGTMPSANPKVVTITATSLCRCEVITATKTVYVYSKLNATFDIIGLSSSGTALTNFDAVAPGGSATTVHQWEIMNSNSASVPGTLVRPVLTLTGAGSTFSVVSATPPALVTGSYYLVRHTMSNQNGLCGPAVFLRLVYISSGMKILDLGDPSADGMTQQEIERKVEDFKSGVKNEMNVRVSPNPSAGKVNVQSDVEIHSIILTDANGKVIETVNQRSNEIMLDLSSLQKGTYFIKVITENGTKLERVVKQ